MSVIRPRHEAIGAHRLLADSKTVIADRLVGQLGDALEYLGTPDLEQRRRRSRIDTARHLGDDAQFRCLKCEHIELDGALDQRRRSGGRGDDVQVGPAWGERGGHCDCRRIDRVFIPLLLNIVFRLFMSLLVLAALTQKSSDVRHLQAKSRAHREEQG